MGHSMSYQRKCVNFIKCGTINEGSEWGSESKIATNRSCGTSSLHERIRDCKHILSNGSKSHCTYCSSIEGYQNEKYSKGRKIYHRTQNKDQMINYIKQKILKGKKDFSLKFWPEFHSDSSFRHNLLLHKKLISRANKFTNSLSEEQKPNIDILQNIALPQWSQDPNNPRNIIIGDIDFLTLTPLPGSIKFCPTCHKFPITLPQKFKMPELKKISLFSNLLEEYNYDLKKDSDTEGFILKFFRFSDSTSLTKFHVHKYSFPLRNLERFRKHVNVQKCNMKKVFRSFVGEDLEQSNMHVFPKYYNFGKKLYPADILQPLKFLTNKGYWLICQCGVIYNNNEDEEPFPRFEENRPEEFLESVRDLSPWLKEIEFNMFCIPREELSNTLLLASCDHIIKLIGEVSKKCSVRESLPFLLFIWDSLESPLQKNLEKLLAAMANRSIPEAANYLNQLERLNPCSKCFKIIVDAFLEVVEEVSLTSSANSISDLNESMGSD